jgi:hypothetical protein
MTFRLAIAFPSEADALRKEAQAIRTWTPTQRLAAVVDALSAVETLSQAGGVRAAQLEYQRRLEEDWRCRIQEFIKHHAGSRSNT